MALRNTVLALALSWLAPATTATAAPPKAVADLKAAIDDRFVAASAKPPVDAIASLLNDRTRVYVRGGPYVGLELARKNLASNPGNAGTGSRWRPIKHGLSSDGQHAFTYGYFDIVGGDPKVARRTFLVYWVREKNGWSAAAFKQGLVPPDLTEIAPQPASAPAHPVKGRVDQTAARRSLVAAEKSFSDRAQVIGLGPAFAEFGRPDSINGGRLSAEAIGQGFGQDGKGPSPVNWSAADALVSPSGDLGITFGTIRQNGPPAEGQPATFPFFTIWMRDGPNAPWRYVAE